MSKGICFIFDVPMCALGGGVERVSSNLTPFLEENGFLVRYLARFPWDPTRQSPIDESRQFFLPDSTSYTTPENNDFVEAFLIREKIRIVIWQHGLDKKFPYSKVCKRLGVKVIVCIHSALYSRRSRYLSEGKLSLKKQIKLFYHEMRATRVWHYNSEQANAVILLGSQDTFLFKQMFPVFEEKIFHIPNPGTFSESSDALGGKEKELLFVGRLSVTDKRPDYLLRIWSKLETRFPEWSLRVVGAGEDEDYLKSLATSLGVRRVYWEGFASPEQFYRSASIFCMTSAFEGFPMVLLEAAAFGCVPVAFDSFAAVRDIISDRKSGYVVPAFDLEIYAETLARLMSEDTLRTQVAKSALEISSTFSLERVGRRWLSLLSKLG